MARFLRAAVILGPDRVRTLDLSSWHRVSRSQCRDSIDHCSQTWPARSAGLAWPGAGLATPSAATAETGLPARSLTYHSIRNTWLTCGNGRSSGAGRTWMVRVVIRPCPLSVAVCAIGTSRQGSASRASNSARRFSFTGERTGRRAGALCPRLRLPAGRTGLGGQFIIICGASCRPGAAREPDRGHGERPARRAGQTRGAYSTERNGQSRSSHARTVWYSTGSSSAQSARTQELTAASWSPALTLPSLSLRGG